MPTQRYHLWLANALSFYWGLAIHASGVVPDQHRPHTMPRRARKVGS
jgi:hypothetical protein